TGDTIKVRLTGLGQATKLKLRVNTFGNKSMQMAILGKIDEHLPRFATSDEAPLSLPVPAQDGQTSERGDPHDRVFSLDDTPPSPHDTLPSPAP
ncbi:MAG: hypothetical protein HY000_05870, partial [Planctomycetes bacterium]|nr:hypothetical protein [Planctomycetota bacterium]